MPLPYMMLHLSIDFNNKLGLWMSLLMEGLRHYRMLQFKFSICNWHPTHQNQFILISVTDVGDPFWPFWWILSKSCSGDCLGRENLMPEIPEHN
jgi:hypothetical protein